MSTEIPSKLNQLLQKLPKGAVATDAWLRDNGISNELKRRYIMSRWLEPVGRSACKRLGDSIDWPGAVWGAERQGITFHVGGKTALQLHGISHYIRANDVLILFKESNGTMPTWFSEVLSVDRFRLINTKFLSSKLGISEMSMAGLNFLASEPERAILEHLFLVGKTESFEEASLLTEMLTGLRPNLLQQLLESCRSVKTKRLLLFFGDYYHHSWLKKLDLKRIDIRHRKKKNS